MNRRSTPLLAAVLLMLSAQLSECNAEPYLAVGQGYKCSACHVNPTGGGMRNAFGMVFAQTLMPAHRLPESAAAWTGDVGSFVRLGGDLRESWSRTEVPNQATQTQWGLDQFRLYANVQAIPDRLGIYVDELLAPGSAQTQEAYVRYSDPSAGWYAKAGKFYLPFGWRLQDNTALVREVSGISMTTPDNGVELGLEKGDWSAQVAFTNGTANTGTGSGHQVVAQAVWVQPLGRIGAAVALTNSTAGNRRVFAGFAGLRTGLVAWLGEADLVQDDGFPEGRRDLLAAFGEMNWNVSQGHNLKLTAEYFDPDRHVANDQKNRFSAVYEYTPLPFLQLRIGARRYIGIPQNNVDNRRLLFIEVHGFM